MNKLIKTIVRLAAFTSLFILIFIIAYILFKGIPHLNPALFKWEYTSDNVSLLPSLITTILMIILTLIIAVPLGIFTALYLIEYADKDGRLVQLIRITTETLAGIPSIIYGLFGMLFFVIRLNFQYSLLSGSLTMSIMILPLIIRTTEEALLTVPNSLRKASLGLGAGKLRTIFKIILPGALPGILSGVILSIGRVMGETAALIYTLGTASKVPTGLLSSGRTLAVHMYLLSTEGLHVNEAYATGVVLVLIILLVNGLSIYLSNRLWKGEFYE